MAISLYQQIGETWAKANINAEKPDPVFEAQARALEEQLSKRIERYLAPFNEGCISASELVAGIAYESSRPADGA